MLKKRIASVKQIDKELRTASKIQMPTRGWINTVRRILNMSMDQLGTSLGLTKQGVHALEKREEEGAITIQRLKKVANSFDMELVYTFVPRTSLEDFVEKKSLEKAKEIVRRSHQNMKLEAQQVDNASLQEQVKEISNELKENLSSTLWQ